MMTYLIPARNEGPWIRQTITEIQELESGLSRPFEILVVDNGSHDNTAHTAQEAGARVVACSEIGYGRAIESGLRHARGEWVAVLDADSTYRPFDVRRLELALQEETASAGFAIGTRLRGSIEAGAMPWLHRRLGTPALTALIRALEPRLRHLTDCNCGLRVAPRAVWLRIGSGPAGMSWASWSLLRLAQLGEEIQELPISYRVGPLGRKGHLRTWRDGLQHLVVILRTWVQQKASVPKSPSSRPPRRCDAKSHRPS